MKSNIRIARKLIRIARMLVSYAYGNKRVDLSQWNKIVDFKSITKEDAPLIAELCFPLVWKSAQTIGMDRSDVDDVLQEFALDIMDKVKDGYYLNMEYDENKGKISTYFNQCAHNALIDWARKNRRFKGDEPIIEDTQNYVDKNPSSIPWYEIQMNENVDAFRKCMMKAIDRIWKKNKKHAMIIALSYYGGLKAKEIAERLGVSEDYVNIAKHRSRDILKSELKDVYESFKTGQMLSANLRMSSDFIEDVLCDKGFWEEYKKKNRALFSEIEKL